MALDFAVRDLAPQRRGSDTSQSSRLSTASDSWPSTPLLPHTPTAYGFPRSSSGKSIPIFFDAEDVTGGGESDSDPGPDAGTALVSEKRDLRPLDDALQGSEMDRRLSSYSSSASSRCLSIDSSSVTSVSTAPTEPPSPSPFSTQTLDADCLPVASIAPFPLPLPLPILIQPAPTKRYRAESHNPPLLNARRAVSNRPGTAPAHARQHSFSSLSLVSRVQQAPHAHQSQRCTRRNTPPGSARSRSPPPDAFFDPSSSSRPSTASTFGSVKAIPIRLVPPTPTPSDRALRIKQHQLYHAPSSPLLSTGNKEPRSKPLPSLPIFPTRPATSATSAPRQASPPSTASPKTSARHRSRSEGVYNVPVYPPCIYPPSPPRPSAPSPRSSPRAILTSKFSHRTIRQDDAYSRIESIPLIARNQEHSFQDRNDELLGASYEGTEFVVGESTLQLLIDQEGFRDAKVEFVYKGEDSETGMLEFVAKRPEGGLEREGWPFHVGFLQSPPHLRRLHLNGNDAIDYLRREASLSISNTDDGVYKVSSHSKLDLDLAYHGRDIEGPYFSFAYETKRRLNLVGRPMKGERLLRPLGFVCSREFLSPSQGRKIGFKHLVSRVFTPRTSASLVVRKQKSVSALKLSGEKHKRRN